MRLSVLCTAKPLNASKPVRPGITVPGSGTLNAIWADATSPIKAEANDGTSLMSDTETNPVRVVDFGPSKVRLSPVGAENARFVVLSTPEFKIEMLVAVTTISPTPWGK
jgi:hypothetical protein